MRRTKSNSVTPNPSKITLTIGVSWKTRSSVSIFIYHEVPNTCSSSALDFKPLKFWPQLSQLQRNSGFFHFSVASLPLSQDSIIKDLKRVSTEYKSFWSQRKNITQVQPWRNCRCFNFARFWDIIDANHKRLLPVLSVRPVLPNREAMVYYSNWTVLAIVNIRSEIKYFLKLSWNSKQWMGLIFQFR